MSRLFLTSSPTFRRLLVFLVLVGLCLSTFRKFLYGMGPLLRNSCGSRRSTVLAKGFDSAGNFAISRGSRAFSHRTTGGIIMVSPSGHTARVASCEDMSVPSSARPLSASSRGRSNCTTSGTPRGMPCWQSGRALSSRSTPRIVIIRGGESDVFHRQEYFRRLVTLFHQCPVVWMQLFLRFMIVLLHVQTCLGLWFLEKFARPDSSRSFHRLFTRGDLQRATSTKMAKSKESQRGGCYSSHSRSTVLESGNKLLVQLNFQSITQSVTKF